MGKIGALAFLGIAALWVAGAFGQPQVMPSIRRDDNGDLQLQVSQRVSVQDASGVTSDLVTQSSLDSQLSLERGVAASYASNVALGVEGHLIRNISVASQATSALSGNVTDLLNQINTLRLQITALQAAIPSNISCPTYTLANGAATGHGTHPGALRVLQCDVGFSLTGPNVVVCLATGAWSDSMMTSCAAATPAPTPAPPPYPLETVTCCVRVDNYFLDAYVDGVPLQIEHGGNGFGWDTVGQITFPNTARVLGLHAADAECGCLCGEVWMTCGTPSGNGPWNTWTPTSLHMVDNSQYRDMINRRWKVNTVDTLGMANYDRDGMSIGGDFTRAQSSAWLARNNFTNITTSISIAQGRPSNQPITWRLQRLQSAVVSDFSSSDGLPADRQCPAMGTGTPGMLYSSPTDGMGGVCGYPPGEILNQAQGRRAVHWYFRYDSQA